ncbi:MAG: hypothetical protein K1W00_00485 [Lachnospiraceae bacterium]
MKIMNDDWLKNPKLKHIDKKKLKLLISLTEQAEKKEPDKLLPFFIEVTNRANSMGITFNDDETDIILNVLKARMSPEDIKKIEMIKNLSAMITEKSKKGKH